MKHIILTGPRESGKTLFSRLIFGNEKTMFIDGKGRALKDPFLFDVRIGEKWEYETVVIDDVSSSVAIDEFLQFASADRLRIDRRGLPIEYVAMPRFILILDDGFGRLLPRTFYRKFHVVDFGHSSVAEFTKILSMEKIRINTTC